MHTVYNLCSFFSTITCAMDQIRLKAYGKINIGLDVTGRREDGYHLVKMILQTVDLYDEVVVRKQPEGILVKTNKPYLPCDERNLAYKAAKMLIDRFGLTEGVRIDIGKNIPTSAGMAGGSTDAAAVLKAVNKLFDLQIDDRTMDEIAVKLGADVPFCLRRGTYLAEGIGEELTRLPDMPECWCLLINPGFGVSTKMAYDRVDALSDPQHPDIDSVIRALGRKDAQDVALNMGNLLEQAVIPVHPEIQEIKDRLKANGAMGAMMSGSGSTVFGLFDNENIMEQAYNAFEGEEYGKFKIKF